MADDFNKPQALATDLTLFGTSACHLCELAQQRLEHHHENVAVIDYTVEDISESDALFQRYGVRIPVLRRSDGEELDWPFSASALASFLEAS